MNMIIYLYAQIHAYHVLRINITHLACIVKIKILCSLICPFILCIFLQG